ncbi:DUF262 domain-containing protein [Limnoraphis robusta]|uniref:DUF262 domain-containing protein n=1 Tax=Limnoraphis robusta CCNP1315 TaxID=3110306 RepID=A0ABU5TUH3_9CYAN|nr:DUF262 domain-containing protein [Limnoraphis robusta]MEA5518543.1 DUF262 domain-containing protein [Limnoraphis robusta CCNP1315]MEA5548622.1 DUF262 domain-containing protein [Limnoraphis robusta CCNP1324]
MTEFNNQNQVFSESDIDSDDITISELEEDDLKIEERDIHEPFDPTKIRVDTRPMTIDLVLKRIKYGEIILDPDFQRRADIWTKKAQSLLIESILIRIPLPAFYMDATNEDQWLVIDGLQRLSTLKNFVLEQESEQKSDKKLRLTGLEFLSNFENKTYEELPRNYQRRIDETVLNVYLIEKGSPPEVKFNIFKRINTGAEPLSPQELRNALNSGKAKKFLEKLANFEEFREITRLSEQDRKRMYDQELVLGCVAFMLTPYQNYPAKKGKDYFLNEAMKKINKMNINEEKEIEDQFKLGMKAIMDIFNNSAGWKDDRIRRSIKYTIKEPIFFAAWLVTLSKLNSHQIEILKNKSRILRDKFIEDLDEDQYPYLITSLIDPDLIDPALRAEDRFMTIEQIVQEVLL